MSYHCPCDPTKVSTMQCIDCRHQHRRYRAADGTITFVRCSHPLFDKDTAERELLARICMRDAARGECVQFEALVLEPDAYWAEDIIPPVPGPEGRFTGLLFGDDSGALGDAPHHMRESIRVRPDHNTQLWGAPDEASRRNPALNALTGTVIKAR